MTRPDGVMLQLCQRSSERHVWLWVSSGTSHTQASPWSSPLTLSHWRECNELDFISSLPPGGMQLVSGSADFIRNFPPMSAVCARQHPQQGPLLSCSGSGGSGGGGEDGSSGRADGDPSRPGNGLLWQRFKKTRSLLGRTTKNTNGVSPVESLAQHAALPAQRSQFKP